MFEDTQESYPDDKSEKELKFYYNREKRIANAPQIVQDYYNGKMKPVRGIKIFFQKQNIWILFALILFVGAAWVYSGLNSTRAYGKIDGVNFELQAFSFEQHIYATVKTFRTKKNQEKYEKNGEKYKPAKVEVEFFAIEQNNQVSDKSFSSIIFENNEEYIRAKFTDFDIIRVDAIVKLNDKQIELSGVIKNKL